MLLLFKKKSIFSWIRYFDRFRAVSLEATRLYDDTSCPRTSHKKKKQADDEDDESQVPKMFLVSTPCFYLLDNNPMCWSSNFWSHIPITCSSVV